MRGRPTAQAAFAILRVFVARWYANVLQVHTRLKVELDHGRGGAKSRAGCPPSDSSGAKVLAQPTVTVRDIQSFYALNCALSRDTPLRSKCRLSLETRSMHYTFKFSDKPLAYIVTQCL